MLRLQTFLFLLTFGACSTLPKSIHNLTGRDVSSVAQAIDFNSVQSCVIDTETKHQAFLNLIGKVVRDEAGTPLTLNKLLDGHMHHTIEGLSPRGSFFYNDVPVPTNTKNSFVIQKAQNNYFAERTQLTFALDSTSPQVVIFKIIPTFAPVLFQRSTGDDLEIVYRCTEKNRQ